jgi:hypothetical protein
LVFAGSLACVVGGYIEDETIFEGNAVHSLGL